MPPRSPEGCLRPLRKRTPQTRTTLSPDTSLCYRRAGRRDITQIGLVEAVRDETQNPGSTRVGSLYTELFWRAQNGHPDENLVELDGASRAHDVRSRHRRRRVRAGRAAVHTDGRVARSQSAIRHQPVLEPQPAGQRDRRRPESCRHRGQLSDAGTEPGWQQSDQDRDLFVIRVAGNIVNRAEAGVVGSMAFAVLVLGAPLVMVLGHSNCGAVEAALNGKKDSLPASIRELVAMVQTGSEKDLAQAIVANVKAGVAKAKEIEPNFNRLIQKDQLKIMGGVYDLASGRVSVVG
jgi:hypothetical protein